MWSIILINLRIKNLKQLEDITRSSKFAKSSSVIPKEKLVVSFNISQDFLSTNAAQVTQFVIENTIIAN